VGLYVKTSVSKWNRPRAFLLADMSDAIKNVAIFGSTGMTGLATLPIAVTAGNVKLLHNDIWPGTELIFFPQYFTAAAVFDLEKML